LHALVARSHTVAWLFDRLCSPAYSSLSTATAGVRDGPLRIALVYAHREA